MSERIKSALNNSLTWLLFLVGCVLLLWKKEKHLEDQLKEQKFDDALKETKDEQAKIDGDANDAVGKYEQLQRDYNLRSSVNGLLGGGKSAAKADSDPGSTN